MNDFDPETNEIIKNARAELAELRAKVAAHKQDVEVAQLFLKAIRASAKAFGYKHIEILADDALDGFASPDPDTGEGMKEWQEGHAG